MIKFTKMSGSGNDFILIDNRDKKIDYNKNFIEKVCKRSLSVGADGIIFIEKSTVADFKWAFFNSDGSVAEMCGNGSRCAARFAYLNNIAGKRMKFETLAGIIEAEIKEGVNVKVQLTQPFDEKLNFNVDDYKLSYINTGVPHAVIETDNIESVDIVKSGAFLRYHNHFAPAGTNVDFYEVVNDNTVKMRTYERGVEAETLACGTGAAAVSIIASKNNKLKSPITVITRSGLKLKIYLENEKVYLEGEARVIYTGELDREAFEY
ncbi:diaminopimelate epimerase [Deferribacterales bacterium Es71-Z0220]|uniref:diaminopimelate epimerase n=1 Tax=Deferrivibrio essentukiensis TaxID=2880922 RepID=UPI001F611314|nr:diaminopimelate epimerase [Deferrivibrio essentukiensis]MCB4203880.1 diaminopimelate epimerase [Deferrivibrio essentukiensis]